MNVWMMSKTQDAIKVAFTAIRTCYSPSTQDDVWNRQYDEYVAKNGDHLRLIKQIVNHGHRSTLEHVQFTFAINGVSRSLLAQLTRHRIGFAYSVQSQRYVRMESDSKSGGMEFVIPPSIKNSEETVMWWGAEVPVQEAYIDMMKDVQENYDLLRKAGIKAEDARYVLPNSATTNITLSMNLRAFIDLYEKRGLNDHAQWEIRELVLAIKDVIVEEEPWIEELLEEANSKC